MERRTVGSSAACAAVEPILIQAQTQLHAGAIEQHAAIAGCDLELLADLGNLELEQFTHGKYTRHHWCELVQTKIHDVEELRLLQGFRRITPIGGRFGPMPCIVKKYVEVGRVAGFLLRDLDVLLFLANQVDDLVLENTDQPGAQRRLARKARGVLQSCQQ